MVGASNQHKLVSDVDNLSCGISSMLSTHSMYGSLPACSLLVLGDIIENLILQYIPNVLPQHD